MRPVWWASTCWNRAARAGPCCFLQGSDRLAMLFVERYERYARNGVLHVRGGQQSLSNAPGLCLKTINRSIKKFAEQGLITKEGTSSLSTRTNIWR